MLKPHTYCQLPSFCKYGDEESCVVPALNAPPTPAGPPVICRMVGSLPNGKITPIALPLPNPAVLAACTQAPTYT